MPAITTPQNITLEYEDSGPRNGPVVLLIMGYGGQLVFWPDAFCRGLEQRGYRVIRYDNRDVGLSSKLDQTPRYSLTIAVLRALFGWKSKAPYSLDDMALDAVGLLTALKLQSVHVIGVSMGGMIGQILTARFPQYVSSFCSLMSTSSNPALPRPKPYALWGLLQAPARSGEARIRQALKVLQMIGSPGYDYPQDELRALVERQHRRNFHPPGLRRQLLAVLATPSRVDLLTRIRVPTLVIHGTADPLLPVAGGKDTAKHIPGAHLELIEGMGHDLPPALIPRLLTLIGEHIESVEYGKSIPECV